MRTRIHSFILILSLAPAAGAFARPSSGCDPDGGSDSLEELAGVMTALPGHLLVELAHSESHWAHLDISNDAARSSLFVESAAPSNVPALDGCVYVYPGPALDDTSGPDFTVSTGGSAIPAINFAQHIRLAALTPGTVYGVTWPAGTDADSIPAPASSLPMVMPDAFTVTSPDLTRESVNSGPLDVTWTGGTGSGEMWIRILYDRTVDPYEIVCRAKDDGSFAVNHGLAIGLGKMTLTRVNETSTVLSDGTTVSLKTSWSAKGIFWGSF